ncbi:unnamed protein product [Discosporangium mesarthrocarpum]
MVESVNFSMEGRALVSGGRDNTVRIWDLRSVLESNVSGRRVGDSRELAFPPVNTFQTKDTPVFSVHFTDKNLVIAAGPMSPPQL